MPADMHMRTVGQRHQSSSPFLNVAGTSPPLSLLVAGCSLQVDVHCWLPAVGHLPPAALPLGSAFIAIDCLLFCFLNVARCPLLGCSLCVVLAVAGCWQLQAAAYSIAAAAATATVVAATPAAVNRLSRPTCLSTLPVRQLRPRGRWQAGGS